MKSKLSRRSFIKTGFLAAIGLLLLDIFWFEKYVIDWNFYDVSGNNKNSIKIFHLTDLHITSLKSFHKSIARKINQIQPDIIFLTGDSVNSTEEIWYLNEFLELIDHDLTKIAILGNWEYWGQVDLEKLRRTYASHNCSLLINENEILTIRDREVDIIGLDDLLAGTPNLSTAMSKASTKSGSTKIMLAHCPQHRDKMIEIKDIDLVLSGHTHGGQVSILGYAPIIPPGSGRYVRGWYDDYPKTYVSKGIGTSRIPIRLGSRAEVAVITI